MSERLLQAVVADPRSDEPRLAYARGVKGTNPEHAELIELQIELARGGRGTRERQTRERKLKQKLGLLKRVRPAKAGTIRRGFVEGIVIGASDFLARGKTIRKTSPILDVRFIKVEGLVAKLCESPLLSGLRSLRFNGAGLDDDDVSAIAGSSFLGELRWLGLKANDITTAGLEALVASENLPKLAHVEFSGNPSPDPTPEVVMDERGFVHLVQYPESGVELQAKYGRRVWLGDEPSPMPRVEHF